jgi:putative PIN family toxin of toxin-antitoxin system
VGTQRIVIDTNVIISAYGWGGLPKRAVDCVLYGDYTLVMPEQQAEELARVLCYSKLGFSATERQQIVDIIGNVARIVETHGGIDIIREDPSDNMLLEAAIENGAAYIVTGDSHLLKLREFRGIKILTPAQFLAATRQPF